MSDSESLSFGLASEELIAESDSFGVDGGAPSKRVRRPPAPQRLRTRRNFTATVAWPRHRIVTDADGTATFTFVPTDSVGALEVRADVVGTVSSLNAFDESVMASCSSSPPTTATAAQQCAGSHYVFAMGEGTAAVVAEATLAVDVKLPHTLATEDFANVPISVSLSDPARLPDGTIIRVHANVVGASLVRAGRVTVSPAQSSCALSGGACRAFVRIAIARDAAAVKSLRNGNGTTPTSLPSPEVIDAAFGDKVTLAVHATVTEDVSDSSLLQDAVERTFLAVPATPGAAFTHAYSFTGTMRPGESAAQLSAFLLPSALLDATGSSAAIQDARLTISVDTSVTATLLRALGGLLQEPYGCFEQTASTTYPTVMALRVFLLGASKTPVVDAELEGLIAKATELTARGLRKLLQYETSENGFEWFGITPPHEALTAYGAMLFADMAAASEELQRLTAAGVLPRAVAATLNVSAEMRNRTAAWLESRRGDGGSFRRSTGHAWDDFGRAPVPVTDAYVTWAMLEAAANTGLLDNAVAQLQPEIERVARLVPVDGKLTSEATAYTTALAANVLQLAGRQDAAARALAWLDQTAASIDEVDGQRLLKYTSGGTSITCSSGRGFEIETTALAIVAGIRCAEDAACAAAAGDRAAAINDAAAFVESSQQGGRFGSTQSTILALRALVDVGAWQQRRSAVDGADDAAPVIEAVTRSAAGADIVLGSAAVQSSGAAAVLDDFPLDELLPKVTAADAARLAKTVSLRVARGTVVKARFEARLTFGSRTPPPARGCDVSISVALGASATKPEVARAEATEGTTLPLNVTVGHANPDGRIAQGMAVAIVAIPAGLEAEPAQLRGLVAAKRIAAYELRRGNRELVLYWRQLPKEPVTVVARLHAAIPGTYFAAPAVAYLYYADEHRSFAPPLAASVAARSVE